MPKRILKLVVSLLLWAWDEISDTARLVLGGAPRGGVAILYFHAVPEHHAARFAWQLGVLCKAARPISLGELKGLRRGERYVAVTFDDGYVSVLRYGLPQLERLQIPCTVFVSTESLGKPPMWVRNADHRFARETVVDSMQLREMASMPLVSVGSHGVTHAALTGLTARMVKEELLGSKSALEQLTGKPVEVFSFPHGCYDQMVLRTAAEVGYSMVFSIGCEYLGVSGSEFLVHRVPVEPTEWSLELRLKARGAYRWLWLVSRMRPGRRCNRTRIREFD